MATNAEILDELKKINSRLDQQEEVMKEFQEFLLFMGQLAINLSPILEQFGPMLEMFGPLFAGMKTENGSAINFLGAIATGS